MGTENTEAINGRLITENSENAVYRLLRDYPEAWKNKRIFKGLLSDYLQQDKTTRNLLLVCVEEGIPAYLNEKKELDKRDVYILFKKLVDSCGCNEDIARRVIEIWVNVILGEDKWHSFDISNMYIKKSYEDSDEELYDKDACNGLIRVIFDDRNMFVPEDSYQLLPEIFGTLTARDVEVIELRYGLWGGKKVSYQNLAIRLEMTRNKLDNENNNEEYTKEDIQQIEEKALRKLRHPSRLNKLRYCIKGYEEYERQQETERAQRHKELVERIKTVQHDFVDADIEDMGFSIRTTNCLKRAGINTLGDLCVCTMENIAKIRNLGRQGVEEILLCRDNLGVGPEGMNLPGNDLGSKLK